jgi:hypothetical protein
MSMSRRQRSLLEHTGGDPSAFLPEPAPIEPDRTKSYAEYVAEAKAKAPKRRKPDDETAAKVRQAIERVKAEMRGRKPLRMRTTRTS